MKSSFKTFNTFDKFEKRYSSFLGEDDEKKPEGEESAPNGDMPEDLLPEPEPSPSEEPVEDDDEKNPESQAEVESGVFVSDNKKAQFAKLMLDALMSTPPAAGDIPQQYLNVTTQNSDEVITFIQSLLSLNRELSDTELKNSLKGV